MPLYGVYTLLFSDAGLSTASISVLLLIWSGVGIVLEVPSGALADRFSPRSALVAAGLVRAAGYSLWVLTPGFAGFAAGFVLWGAGGALESGSFQSLLYAGLAAEDEAGAYAAVLGRCRAATSVAEVVATLAAAPLLLVGGFPTVAWVSVVVCGAGSAVAAGFPRAGASRPRGAGDWGGGDLGVGDGGGGYADLLRAGVAEAWRRPPVRRLVLVVAAVTGVTSLDEYVPLLARAAAVPDPWIPVVLAGLPLAAAGGELLAGVAAHRHPAAVGVPLLGASVVLGITAAASHPLLLPALGAWYLIVSLAVVVADSRLQHAVTGPARATVTSVANLLSELGAIAMFVAVALLS